MTEFSQETLNHYELDSPATSFAAAKDSLKDSLKTSETPCWTCRRRRVQCDRVLPTCLKCKKAGKECLGYKKPLVWNKGVASRGRLMGKTFDEVKQPTQPTPPTPSETCSHSSMSNAPDEEVEEVVRTDTVLLPTGAQSSSSQAVATFSNMATQLPRILVDPFFRDFTPLTRYYVQYCR
jgi:hypothetical protein